MNRSTFYDGGYPRAFAACVLLAFLTLAALAVPAQAQSNLVDRAKKEGMLVLYTTFPVEAIGAVSDAFKTKYGIKVDSYIQVTSDVLQKYAAEVDADSVHADVIQVSDLGPFIEMAERNMLTAYLSPEFKPYEARYYDPKGQWFVTTLLPANILYNKKIIPAGKAPTKWEDLLDPAWKGKISIGDPVKGGTDYLWYYVMRKKFGRQFHERLAAQRPLIVPTSQSMVQMVLAGERPISGEMLHDKPLIILKTSPDAPLASSWPSPTPIAVRTSAITRKAPHPAAAQLFMDFLASEEGQKLINVAFGALSARPGVNTPGYPNLKDLQTYTIGPDEMGEFIRVREELRREFQQLYQSGK
jgi:iron(III) transport system substrate-binding protein